MMENQRTVRETFQKLPGVDEASHGANIRTRTSGRMSAIPRRLRLALALNGTGLLATIPFLLKATSLTTAFFSSVGMPCFAAGFLIYTVAVIRDLREHGIL